MTQQGGKRMKFFKMVEITEDTYLSRVGDYALYCDIEYQRIGNTTYIAVNDEQTETIEIDLRDIEEDER